MNLYRRRMHGWLWALALAPVAFAAAQIDPQDVVRKSVVAFDADWQQAPYYSYIERDSQNKGSGVLVVKSFEVRMVEGSPYRRLIAIDDHALAPEKQADEDRKMQRETDRRRRETKKEQATRIGKYLEERNRDQNMIREMNDAFDFQPIGEETVDGHECLVFDTRPRRNYVPKNHAGKVLLGMGGRLWVDKIEDRWVKVEAEVRKPVNFFGFLAKVFPGTKFLLEQQPVMTNLWLPKHFNVKVYASVLGFVNQSSDQDETYRDYKPNLDVSGPPAGVLRALQ